MVMLQWTSQKRVPPVEMNEILLLEKDLQPYAITEAVFRPNITDESQSNFH
jgi:hypothetical protein